MSDNDSNKPFYKQKQIWFIFLYSAFICSYTLIFMSSGPENVMLTSNELGDFLAGIFAPLAFLFLYLGYKQQGKELQQNTDALKLQAKELRESVLQQTLLQQHTEKNLMILKDQIEQQKEKEIISAQPFFHLRFIDYQLIPKTSSFSMNIEVLNSGKTARDFHIYAFMHNGIGWDGVLKLPVFHSNEKSKFSIPFKYSSDFNQLITEEYLKDIVEDNMAVLEIKCCYFDELLKENFQTFQGKIYKKNHEDGFIKSEIKLILRSF
ncbi:hypothetical protein [Acinetobacter wuhouensis]|uniref:hypothetical protein n=1 Tax=Acinetobacter wuhouensis TaxID=1879050 RepID=UPI001D1834D8|nr:hypothetical protein [Acinetobacter wuhouensis]